MAEGLTPKQQAFVEAYLANGFNATDAARRAGYSEESAYKQGWRMSKNVQVQAAIQQGLSERAMAADEVLARLTDQARATAEDFVTVYESPLRDLEGKPILDREGNEIVRRFPSLDIEKARQRGKLHLIKTVRYTAHGPAVELYDAQAALALLGKHHKLFVERTELTGKDGGPLAVQFTEALDAAYADEPASTESE